MFRFSLLARLVALLVLAGLFGCSGASAPPGPRDEVSYEVFPNTIVLEKGDLGSLAPETTAGRLVFDPAPKALDGVTRGRVLVAPRSTTAPKGLLRIVVAASRSGQRLTLDTVDAPLQLAFRKLHAALHRRHTPTLSEQIAKSAQVSPLASDGAHSTLPISLPAFDGDNDLSTLDDQVQAQGYLAGGFDYVFGIDADWGDIANLPGKIEECIEDLLSGSFCSIESLIPEVKVGYQVTGNADAKLHLAGTAFKGYTRSYTVLDVPLEPIEIGILVFFPHVVVTGTVQGKASSRFSVGVEAHAGFDAGVSYSNKSGPSGDPLPDVEAAVTAETPEVTLYANASASVDISVHIKLYDLIGPRAGVQLGAELDADHERLPCYELRSKLAASYGFVIGADFGKLGMVQLASWGDTLPLHEELVASGACTLPPENASGVPGSGPSNDTLLNPSFTPWSRTLGGAVADFPSTHADGLRYTALERTIDGRFALTGSESSAITKLDESGEPTWARRYPLFDSDELAFDPSVTSTRVLRVADTPDAGLVAITYPYGLVKIGQGGEVDWAESFDLPRRSATGPFGRVADQQTFTSIVSDGDSGHFIAGTLMTSDASPAGAWLLHVDHEGQVLSSRLLSTPGAAVYPTVLLPYAGGLFLAGFLHETGGVTLEGFWLVLDASENVKLSRKLSGCGDFVRAVPTTGIVNRAGDVILAGRDGTQERGFVARIEKNGQLGFFSRPWSGSELEDVAVESVVELPTGGYLVAGRHSPMKPAARIFLASLDVVGQPLWARSYVPDGDVEATYPALRLTDDGGAMLTAISGLPGKSANSWSLKVPAKDGVIQFAQSASTQELVLDDDACTPDTSDWSPTFDDVLTPAPTFRSVEAEPVPVSVASEAG